MKYTVVVTSEAEGDARRIAAWKKEHHSPRVSQRWVLAYDAAVESLEESPQRCPTAPEAEFLGGDVRHLLFKSHRLIYRVVKSEVQVLHVRHSAQAWIGQEVEDEGE